MQCGLKDQAWNYACEGLSQFQHTVKFANAFFAGRSVLLEIALVLVKPFKSANQASATSLTKVIPGEAVGAVLLFRAVCYCHGDLLTRAKDERAVGFAGWVNATVANR